MYYLRLPLVYVGLFAYACVLVLFYPVYWVTFLFVKTTTPDFIRWIERTQKKVWMFFSGLRTRVYMEAPLPPKGSPFVVCVNHNSFLDVPVIYQMNRKITFVGSVAYARLPIFGPLYKRMHITLDKKDFKSRQQALTLMQKPLEKGMGLVVFPEGGIRSKNPPQMAPFKKGAFLAAITAQVPLVPATIVHNWTIWPRYSRNPRHRPYVHRSDLYFSAPIETKGMTVNDVDTLLAAARASMEKRLATHYPMYFTQ